MRVRRAKGDAGILGITIETMFGLLLLFLPVLLIVGFGTGWIKRKVAAEDLAADLARAAIQAPALPMTTEDYDRLVSQRRLHVDALQPSLLADYGLDAADVIDVTYSIDIADGDQYRRTHLVGSDYVPSYLTVTVQIRAPGISIPFGGDFAESVITVEHTELIDGYRSITRP
jgi:hypothetical protein